MEYGPSSQNSPAGVDEFITFAPAGYAVTYTPPGGTAAPDPVDLVAVGPGGWSVQLTLADPVSNGGVLQVTASGTNPSPTVEAQFPVPVSNEIIVGIDTTLVLSYDPTTNPITFTAPGTAAAYSPNWSGYALDSGPFSQVTGSFRVPYLTTDATCNEETSEWVGLDGLDNSSLVQAGVSESMTDPFTGECDPGQFYAWAWWEVLPADATPITSWASGSPAVVNAGDWVSVTIGADGSISLIDGNEFVAGTSDRDLHHPAVL